MALPHLMWWSRKFERLAGVVSFEPESNLAEFDSERIQVHAVDAFADHVAHGGAESSGDGCSSPVRTMANSVAIRRAAAKQDVARAAGDVGHAQRKQRLFGIALLSFQRSGGRVNA